MMLGFRLSELSVQLLFDVFLYIFERESLKCVHGWNLCICHLVFVICYLLDQAFFFSFFFSLWQNKIKGSKINPGVYLGVPLSLTFSFHPTYFVSLFMHMETCKCFGFLNIQPLLGQSCCILWITSNLYFMSDYLPLRLKSGT